MTTGIWHCGISFELNSIELLCNVIHFLLEFLIFIHIDITTLQPIMNSINPSKREFMF
jgi:hypothetical protein